MADVLQVLKSLAITYKKYDHPAVFTVIEAQTHSANLPKIGNTKNLFLKTEKAPLQYFLYTLPHYKRADLKQLAKFLNLSSRLTFGSDTELLSLLGITPGSVSPLGLINDINHQVVFLLDPELLQNPTILVHPNINTSTIELSLSDFQSFLNHVRHPAHPVAIKHDSEPMPQP